MLLTAFTLWLLTSTPMPLLVTLACAYRLFTRDWQTEPDNIGLAQFAGLPAALSLVVVGSLTATGATGRL